MEAREVLIVPSLLAADFAHLADEIRRVEEAGADLLHLDIMDGHFVPNLSYGVPVLEAVRRVTDLKLDTHLMLTDPAAYTQIFRDAGADSLTFHLEASDRPAELAARIRDTGAECGIALSPETPIAGLYPLLSDLDLVLIMSVQPGFGGQAFQPQVLDKARGLRGWMADHDLDVPLQIDGGVCPDNASDCREAGFSRLVAGSAVFGDDDTAAAIRDLRG